MVIAIVVPAQILIQGILGPAGVVPYPDADYHGLASLMANPLVKIYLWAVVSLSLIHTAHRVHFWLHHVGIRGGQRAISAVSYLTAIVLSVGTAYVILTAP